jgi:hypothetical protein
MGQQGYGYAYAVNNAVNSCGRQAQRVSGGGRVEIRDVDQVSRGRLRVRGVFDDLRTPTPTAIAASTATGSAACHGATAASRISTSTDRGKRAPSCALFPAPRRLN